MTRSTSIAADPPQRSGIDHRIGPDGSSVYLPAGMHTVRKQLAPRWLSAGPPHAAPVCVSAITARPQMPTSTAEVIVLDALRPAELEGRVP